MKNILVIYHGDCADGFSGAWAAWKKFGNRAEYVAASRHVGPPSVKGKEVYCIDFIYRPASVIKKMEREAARLVLIDHHVSSKPLMAFSKEYWFSLERSGAVLAWEYFHPVEGRGPHRTLRPEKQIPELLRYVEDSDLWKFKLPNSRAIGAYIGLFDFDFRTWEKLAKELQSSTGRRRAAERGRLLLKYQEGIISDIIAHAREVRFEGKKVLAANSPVFDSQIGHALAERRPPFGIVWREEDGLIRVSLRAKGNFDVAKIAQKYGGGGHKAAAGFLLTRGVKLPWK